MSERNDRTATPAQALQGKRLRFGVRHASGTQPRPEFTERLCKAFQVHRVSGGHTINVPSCSARTVSPGRDSTDEHVLDSARVERGEDAIRIESTYRVLIVHEGSRTS